MTPQEDLLFLENDELIAELEGCTELANREIAHQRADEVLVIALLRATANELPYGDAVEMVGLYQQLDKFYG